MGIIKINWNKKITVYPRTHKDTSNSKRFFRKDFPRMIDYSNPIIDFFPAEFPIDNWKSIPEFENWCELNLPEQTGVFYFEIRATLNQPNQKIKKKKAGRPKYTREKLLRTGFWKKPRQKSQSIRTIIAKIEMEKGQVIKTFENKSPRKYAPYGEPKYELIKKIETNAAT